jgi:ribosome biogenesis protein MAK21
MKSLDFGSFKNAATAKGAEAPHAEGSNNEGAEDATKEKTRPKERVSNGKPDARVAEAAAKVAESTRGGKTKFVRPISQSRTLSLSHFFQIVTPTSQWYLALPALKSPSSLPTPSPEYLSSKSTLAASLLLQDVTAYTESSSHTTSTSDARFLTRVLASGTLSDRLSALTLMAQGSPVHNARALESLKAMAAKKGREESLKALRAVVDWWVGGGTPDRKLKYVRGCFTVGCWIYTCLFCKVLPRPAVNPPGCDGAASRVMAFRRLAEEIFLRHTPTPRSSCPILVSR